MRSTFTLTFFVKSKVYANGESPIMGRIRVSGSTKDFSTKLTIARANWDEENGLAKKESKRSEIINSALTVIRGTVLSLKESMLIREGYISATKLRDAYLEMTMTDEDKEKERLKQEKAEKAAAEQARLEKEKKEMEERGQMLIPYFDKYLAMRDSDVQAKNLGEKTFSRYVNARNRLIAFMQKEYKISDIPMKEIDIFFVNKFAAWLKITPSSLRGMSVGNNTVMKIMQKFDTVMTLAHDTGVIPTNPFKLFTYKFDESHREFLTWEELLRWWNYSFDWEKLEHTSDCYLFSCFTGLAWTDTHNFTTDNIRQFFDGQEYISRDRDKSKVESRVMLLEMARQILKKYEGKLPNGKVLPTVDNHKMNDNLKVIAMMLGIKKKLTYHTARHTFATTVCLTNGVPMETLQKMMGHKSIRTTQIYAKLTDPKLSEDSKKWSERLREKMEEGNISEENQCTLDNGFNHRKAV